MNRQPKKIDKKQNKSKNQKTNLNRRAGPPAKTRQGAPVSVGVITNTGKPRFVNRGEDIQVTHREYISDITAATAEFSVVFNQLINAGNVNLFPWLSQIASRFESYVFRQLRFLFETETSTGDTGFVLMTIDYDPTDAAPTSKPVAFNYQGAVKGAPWQCFTHVSTLSNLTKRKTYFVGTNVTADALRDTGRLYVCCGGNAASPARVGELWVEYVCELMTPHIDSTQAVFAVNDAIYEGGGTLSGTVPLGDAPTVTTNGTLLVTYNGSTGEFTSAMLTPIQLLVSFWGAGSTITGLSCPSTGTSGIAVTQVLAAGATSGSESYFIELSPGETFTPAIAAVSISSSKMLICPFGLFE